MDCFFKAYYCIDDLFSDEVTENAYLGSQFEEKFSFFSFLIAGLLK